MLENIFPYLFLSGLAIAAMAFLALVVIAFRYKIGWGVAVLVFPPVGIVFAIKHYRRAWLPSACLAVGVGLMAFPSLYTKLMPVDLGPRERIVNNESHITLTGWDQKDYSPLRLKSDVVVLQMANPDVTDSTLVLLKDFAKLRELDVNDSKITDESLDVLKTLPSLETLRIRNTAVSDQGFTDSLAPISTLKQLDVRGTQIRKESIEAWKDAQPGRRALQ